jgi:cytochrome c peroxidase
MDWKAAVRCGVITLCCILLAQAARALPLPLSQVPVPEPANLAQFVTDKAAAIRLGKALFWDMQVGSDGVQACASCHFVAGADSRLKNQLHPGPVVPPATLAAFDIPGSGPGYLLNTAPFPLGDFPFFQVTPVDGRLGLDPVTGLPLDPNTVILRDVNDVTGSQGIGLADFLAVSPGSAQDAGNPQPSPLFGAARQVTGRNAPSVINAVFNYANFWDGRANNIFNGVNPLGPLDQNAALWMDDGAPGNTLVPQQVAIPNASLASQATGPPLSSVEMSFAGRSFPELARKLLGLAPLAQQLVHPADSALGTLSRATLQPDGTLSGNRGLNTSYLQMIKDAFAPRLWSSSKEVALAAGPGEGNARFSQVEANFSLFWGLAIQLYEATLVSDQTPFDRFLAGNVDALSPGAQNGLATFVDKCAVCHAGSELTSAVVGSPTPSCLPPDCNRLAFGNNSSHSLIRPDTDPNTFVVRLADAGFFNIGVRPTSDDPGRGAGAAQGFPFPLSFTRLAQSGGLPFVTPRLPAGSSALTPAAVDGAFKTPGLRNVELSAPYFHNGSANTLNEVIEFYTRGGNFPNNPELAAAMQPIRNLRGSPVKRGELVAFLNALTDERVRNRHAPFDHPEILIPSGDPADTPATRIALAATGGAPPPAAPALALNPPVSPTSLTSQTLSGTVAASATVEVQVNVLPPLFATVTGGIWNLALTGLPVGDNTITVTARTPGGGVQSVPVSLVVLPVASIGGIPPGAKTTQTGATLTIGGQGVTGYQYSLDGSPMSALVPVATPVVLSGLSDGTHLVSVLGRDASGHQQPADSPTSATWTVKANPPLLTLDPVLSPVRGASQTIGGSVELGSIPAVSVGGTVQAGPVSVIGGNGVSRWSCTLTGLAEGANPVSVLAVDFVFNRTTVSASIVRDSLAPALTLDAAGPAIGLGQVTLSGSVEAGLTPVVGVPGASVGAVQVLGTLWSCPVTGLAPGDNAVGVTALDAAGNQTSRSATVRFLVADGNLKGSGVPDISDALAALRIAVGINTASAADLLHGDVAPLVNGVPAPNGVIDVADALAILRKVVGVISF